MLVKVPLLLKVIWSFDIALETEINQANVSESPEPKLIFNPATHEILDPSTTEKLNFQQF
jgi:hypothetical protein